MLLYLPATNWIGLRKLQELDVSDNRLVELPTAFLCCLKSLNVLHVSRNNLKVFPDPWACPLVSQVAPSGTKACIYLSIVCRRSAKKRNVMHCYSAAVQRPKSHSAIAAVLLGRLPPSDPPSRSLGGLFPLL